MSDGVLYFNALIAKFFLMCTLYFKVRKDVSLSNNRYSALLNRMPLRTKCFYW